MGALISNEYLLLLADFDYDGVQLDVYGDNDGEVLGLTAPGCKHDIATLVRDEVVAAAQRAVDATARERRQHHIDQIQFDRDLAKLYRRAA